MQNLQSFPRWLEELKPQPMSWGGLTVWSAEIPVARLRLNTGHSYHFITAGDVDSLSYLKAILRSRSLTHVLISTWCMSAEDILQLRQWQEDGRLSTIDLYVGEIFPNTYKVEWSMLREWEEAGGLNRLCVFRNHSKIYAGTSGDFAFVVETSANVNTNPRTEQGVVTIDRGLYDFYKEYFDGIKSFE